MGKHAFSLKTIYLTALTAVFAVSFFAFVAFDLYSQQRQTEQAMLEEARTFAREMDVVWQFMDNSQSIINNSSSGGYEFKGLHCSVVGKSVGRLFSAGSDYHIRYTNFDPRSEQDIPDEFETKALEAFNAAWPRSTARIGSATFKRSKWTTAALNATASRSASSTSPTTRRKVGRSSRSAGPSAS